MRLSLYAVISASLLAVVVVHASPRSMERRQGSDPPGRKNPDPKLAEEMQGYDFPAAKLVRHPDPRGNMDCDLQVEFDSSRCTGSAYRYKQLIVPYDEYSTNYTYKPSVKTEGNQYYAKSHLHLPCKWNGRAALTDTPELTKRTGLRGVRIMTEESGHSVWLDTDPDEETHLTRTLIAPLIYYYFSDTPTTFRGPNTNQDVRGYNQTLLTTKQKRGSQLYVQYC